MSWGLTIAFFFLICTEESEDESDVAEPSEGNEDGEDTFMKSYSDVLNQELKSTTLKKSFVRANEQAAKKDEVYFLSSEDDYFKFLSDGLSGDLECYTDGVYSFRVRQIPRRTWRRMILLQLMLM